ncbi:E3 ubiquitin- ligase RING1-like [Brachionus plicatilis]|uniref:E3 ubiquitin-ligase RING1-like n=1 Tax=Brachionus plicatilis TaxID=10195 RepID=A0A3M7P206_BRAPC|nr:E3 ubiquitin- ligase RING1-like [Brachionus plicatilis]
MSNFQKDDREESIGSKLLSGLLWGAAIGVGAFVGYQIIKSITKEEVEKLPIKIAQFTDKSIECTICLNYFERNDRLKILPCNHKFHSDCILKWVERNSNCPLCRRENK